jgi:hypothetical protein
VFGFLLELTRRRGEAACVEFTNGDQPGVRTRKVEGAAQEMTKDRQKIEGQRREVHMSRALLIGSLLTAVALIIASFALIRIATSPSISCAKPPIFALRPATLTCILDPR